MHDFLQLLSSVQALTSWQSYVRGACYTAGAILLWYIWRIDTAVAKVFSVLLLSTVFYFIAVGFLESPKAFGVYLLTQTAWLVFSIGRAVLKCILVMLSLLLSAVYFVSPCDIIPDVIIGIGWIDDILIAIGLVSYAARSDLRMPDPSSDNTYLSLHPLYRFGIPATIAVLTSIVIRAVI